MVDFLVLCLLLLLLYGSRFVPKGELNRDYLSLGTCGALRGFFALVVVFEHLAVKIETGCLLRLFQQVDNLAVAVFFFYSGYGLMKRHIADPNYTKNFFKKRIPPVLLPYLLVTFLYWVCHAATGNVYTGKEILTKTFLLGSPIASFSWYILAILAFYVFFLVLMLVFRQHYGWMILGECVGIGLYVRFCDQMGYGTWWYTSAFSLVMGSIWAYKEPDLLSFLDKYYCAVVAAVLPVFCATFLLGTTASRWISVLALKNLSACLFCALVLLLALKVRFGNRVLAYLGKRSMEIYLLHGIPILLLRSEILYVEDDFLWCAAVIFLTVALAATLHNLCQKLFSFRRETVHSAE